MPRASHLPRLAGFLVVLLAGCDTARPVRGTSAPLAPAPPSPLLLGGESIAGEIGPGEHHLYRLDAGPDRWLTIELAQREVDLDLTVHDAAGAVVATARTPGNWSTEALDVLTGAGAGPLTVEIAAAGGGERAGGYRLRLAEDRPARADDAARRVARHRLRELERPAAGSPPLSAEERETELRALLETTEISWTAEEAARILELLGNVLLAQRRPEDASAAFRAGLDLLPSDSPDPLAAYLNVGLGAALALQRDRLGDARRHYERAVAIAQALGDGETIGVVANIAAVFFAQQLHDFDAAIRTLEETITGMGDSPPRVDAHLNLALFLRDARDLESAMAHIEAAERLAREAAIEGARLVLLRTGGTLYRQGGEVEKALDAFEEALRLAIAQGETDGEMSIRNHLGVLLVQLGEYAEARRHLSRYAEWAQRSGSGESQARAFLALAWVEMGESAPEAAATLLGRALAIEGLSADLDGLLRYGLAVAKTKLGERASARELLEPLAARAEADGLLGPAARFQHALGSLYLAEGAFDQAAVALGRAAELAEAVGDPLRQAAVRSHLAELEDRRGRPAAALEQVREAIRLRETVRSRLVEPDLRSTFLARWRSDFDRAIEMSMRLAAEEPGGRHDRLAFAFSEAAHARTLTELLAEASVDVRKGISAELLAAERQAELRLSRAQIALSREPGRGAQAETLRGELERARREREEMERRIRLSHPRYAEIRYPRPPDLEQVQQWLPARTALIEYALGDSASAVFLVTRDDFLALPLPSAEEIAAGVAEARQLLAEPSELSRWRLAAIFEDLTRILVTPLADRLAEVDRLLVVPDRDLFYLPFEALGDPAAPARAPGGLLRRWSVAYLPAAAVLPHLGGQSPREWSHDLVAFADPPPSTAEPAGPDGSMRGDDLPELPPSGGLPSLPGAQREARRIAELFPADRVSLLVGEQARESVLKSSAATAATRRLHIASHGVISVTDPEDSYVLLAADPAEDGRLHLHEVFDLDLDAELVVLSGCETGLGPRLDGEGLLGLVRGFLYAGASDVVVSLWPVSDDPTEDLMVDFYRLLVAGRPTADALRAAKLARLNDGDAHPSFWAPFVVFGAPASPP